MQSLGKVPSARRAPQPVNLPSLKAESGGGSGVEASAPTAPNSQNPVGWIGSAADSSTTGGSSSGGKQQPTQQQPAQQQSPAPPKSPLPAAVAPTPVAAVVVPLAAAAPVAPSAPAAAPVYTIPGPNRAAGRQGGQRPATDLLELKFQQEFPSLTADTVSGRSDGPPQQPATKKVGPPAAVAPLATAGSGASGPPGADVQRQESPQPLQYGPGPSLRPQTEGSWVQGGRTASNSQPPMVGPGKQPVVLDLVRAIAISV